MENIKLLELVLKRSVDVHLTPFLWGKHGIAKSAIIRQSFERLGYEVIDLRLGQLEVGDLIGMPAQEYFCPKCQTKFGFAVRSAFCPICEQERKPDNGFLSKLSAPARRALEHHGITTLQQLFTFSEKEILKFHGIGPASLPILRASLEESGLLFTH